MLEESKESLYQLSLEEDARSVVKTLALLAVTLFPLFSILDYISQYESYVILSLIRFSTTIFYLVIYLLLRKGIGLKHSLRTCLIMLFVGSFSITLMCMNLEGAESPYYAGVNLVVLAGVLILPVNGFQMFKVVMLLIGVYVLGVLWVERFDFENIGAFINNMFFLVSTGTIGVAASSVKDKMRKRAFFQNLEVKRTIDVLKADLQGQENSIEKLAKQMVERKSEVQIALATRDGFISIASHELRSPLTSMKLQLDIALHKMKFSEPVKEELTHHINAAKNGVERIVRLVDELLDVSRIQSGNFSLEKKEAELNDIVQTVMARQYIDHISTGRIKYILFEGTLKGLWDNFKIEQVILNLINNSLRYGNGSQIEVQTGMLGRFCFLSVSDQGPGIDPDEQEKIFEKFEKGRDANVSGGLGLGLYISNEIIRTHDGKIEVKSAPGKGSTFTFYLPLNYN